MTALRHIALRAAAFAILALAPRLAAASPSIVVDIGTGRVLHAEDAFARWNPASLTKLMTAYAAFSDIAAGRLTLQAPVRISANAANNPPSRMGYPVGTVLTLDTALTIMIVKSANDVAAAVGEAVEGSPDAFVARMNAEAARLGMTDTHFENANGLYRPGQYTTARDLAVLTRAIRTRFPQFAHYFSTEAIRYGDRVEPTYNLLLGRFDGADGMKTGYVCASGFNLVATATRGPTTLAAIVLGAPSQEQRADKAARLLEEGFAASAGESAYPPLAGLTRPADAPTEVANMRSVICTEEAEASRWDGRAVEGHMSFDTPSIHPLQRDLVAVPVRTGGAVGASRSAIMLFGKAVRTIPVPTERPERLSLFDENDPKYQLRDGIPVPLPRPKG